MIHCILFETSARHISSRKKSIHPLINQTFFYVIIILLNKKTKVWNQSQLNNVFFSISYIWSLTHVYFYIKEMMPNIFIYKKSRRALERQRRIAIRYIFMLARSIDWGQSKMCFLFFLPLIIGQYLFYMPEKINHHL